MVDSSCRTENIQQRTDATGAVPEREAKANPSPGSSEEDRNLHSYSLDREQCDPKIMRMTLDKDLRRARCSQSGCCQDCQRSSQSLEHRRNSCTRFERASLPPRSSRQWRCRRKSIAGNVKRSCRSKGDQQSEINLARGEQQDCDSVEQQLSVSRSDCVKQANLR